MPSAPEAPEPEPRGWQVHAAAVARADRAAPPTLQELCVRLLARGELLEGDVARLPHALAHKLLDECVASRRVSRDTLASFLKQCPVYDVSLAHLPAVTDDWLDSLSLQARSLQRLSLCGCVRVSDHSLRSVGACTLLRSLSLAGCSRLTDDGVASLASLSLLTELSLQGCTRLTGRALQHLERLTRLVSLDLSTCRGVASLTSLRTLAQLERLLLGWTAVTDDDMQHIASCGSLTQLQLCRTRVGDAGIAALAGRLPLLRQLDLTGCRVSDASSAALASFVRLTELSLAGCAVSSAALRELGHAATELAELNLAHTGITDDGLRDSVAPLGRLASLDLECCSVTDAGVAALRGCLNLGRLVLSDTATSNSGLRQLAGVPLHTLSLSFTGVSDVGLDGLSPLLEDLRLDTRGITDAGLRRLSHLTRLRRLDLFGARVSDAGLPHLLVLRHLRELDICGGGLTDAGMPAIAAMTLLERLNLSQNWRISDESVPHLCTLRQLRSLSLSGTGVTGAGVLLFAAAPPRLEALAVYGCDVAREAEQVQAARPSLRVTWTEHD